MKLSDKILFSLLFLFLFLGPFSSQTYAAAKSWVGGVDSNWETAGNWSPASKPTSTDDITIDATTTVNINGNDATTLTINSLTLGNTNSPTLNFAYDATPSALMVSGGDLTVGSNATITHSAGTGSVVGKVYINVTAGSATINGTINVDGKGYAGNSGASGSGLGGGTGSCSNSYRGGGGSYGGTGSTGASGGGAGGSIYGSLIAPVDLGSAGGGSEFFGCKAGGSGGGAVRLDASGTITISGTISANGNNGVSGGGGGGSGGSIYLNAGTLAGSGTIRANGGDGTCCTGPGAGGGGGGGRIALYYSSSNTTTASITTNLGANGSAVSYNAGYGTAFIQDSVNADITIPATALNGKWQGGDRASWNFRNITINNGVYFSPSGTSLFTITSTGTTTFGSSTFTVYVGGSYSSNSNGVGVFFNLTGNVTIPQTLTFTANGLGYAGSTGNGSGTGGGTGGSCSNSSRGGGGGYGGAGSSATGGGGAGGTTYGNSLAPTDLGSGGGGGEFFGCQTGGNGGGAIKIVTAGTLTVSGTLTANGNSGSSNGAGGGAGGSIYLVVGGLAGQGTISATGGNGMCCTGPGTGGGGGGGRIAIYYLVNSWSGNALTAAVATAVGSNGTGGGNGTMVLSYNGAAPALGSLATYWKFDEGQGTTLHDATAQGWSQTATNSPSWLTDDQCVSGKCLSFDGSNDYAANALTTNLQNTKQVTIEFWLKLPSFDTSGNRAMEMTADYTAATDGFYITPDSTVSGKIQFGLKGDGGVTDATFPQPTTNTWHHYVFILDKTSGANLLGAYVDGVSQTLTYLSRSDNTNFFANDVLYLMSKGGASLFLKGYLDEVRFFNYDRTATQILGDLAARSTKAGTNTNFGRAFPNNIPSAFINGLMGYWKLDESSGTSAADVSGNSNTGTDTSTTVGSAGKFGSARTFNGTSSYISTGNGSSLQITGALTLSAWIKLTTNSAVHDIIAKDGASGNFGYRLFTDAGGKLNLEISSDGTATTSVTGYSFLNTGTWYHVAGVYDPSNALTVYVDGVLDGQNSASIPSSIYNSTANVNIGAQNAGGSNFMSGLIDEVRVYNRALPAKPIAGFAESSGSYGNGSDGAITISSNKNLNTDTIAGGRSYADGIAYRVTAPALGATSVTRFSGSDTLSNGIAANDLVLLINLQGTSSDFNDVGNYELLTVQSVNASTITFTSATTKSYTGTSAANQKVVVQRIPQYTSVTINGSTTLNASAWDGLVTTPTGTAGYLTGIVAFKASGTLTVTGSIDVSGKGFIGGSAGSPNDGGGGGGQTFNGTGGSGGSGGGASGGSGQGGGGGASGGGSASGGTGSYGGGGGGGAGFWCSGGGGGGYGTAGSGAQGGNGGSGNSGSSGGTTIGGNGGAGNGTYAGGGGGGGTYGNAKLSSLFFGSGGGGGAACHQAGGSGGAGGGIIIIWANSVSSSGSISANGTNGGNATAGCSDGGGGGGGGAGGSVLISTTSSVLGITASGGSAGSRSCVGGNGAAGGSGRIASINFLNIPVPNIQTLYEFAPGPVGYWKFDEATGTTAYDTSGYSNNGTLTNSPTWSNGKFGKAISFDGTDDYVSISSFTGLSTGNSSHTIEAWIKPNATPSTRQWPLLLGQENTGAHHWLWNTNGTLSLGIWGVTSCTVTPVIGSWNHIATTYDGTTLRCYLNGTLVQSITTSSFNFTSTALTFAQIHIAEAYFAGSMDDIKIYNYGRTAAQVVQDMNAGHPAPGSPVGSAIGHWKFDEGVDNTCSGGTNDVCNSGSAGSALDGTSTAVWTQNGKFGKALSFGASSVVTIPDNNALDLGSSGTISVWVYRTGSCSPGSFSCAIVDKGNSDSNSAHPYRLNIGTNNKAGLILGNNSTSESNSGTPAGLTIPANQWTNVTAVWTGTQIQIYINGALVDTGTQTITPYNSSDSVVIGESNYNPTADEHFVGSLDDVKIYNFALTADQIKADMNQRSSQSLGALSDTSGLTGGSTASNSAAAEYCVPGDTTSCAPPVGEWHLNENTGSTGYDTSGNSTNITLNVGSSGSQTTTTQAWNSGKFGASVNLDGTDDYMSASPKLPTADFTYSLWVKTTDTDGELLMASDGSGGNELWIKINGSNNLSVATNNTQRISQSVNIHDNKWNFVSVTRSGSTISLYVNGIFQTSGTDGGALSFSTCPLLIGVDSDTACIGSLGEYTQGQFDDIRVFNYARSATQIAWDYNHGKPLGWWKLDECTGSSAKDSSGNANIGTITIGSGAGAGHQDTAGDCSTNATTAWYNGRNGKFNSSLNFDGIDDKVSISQNSNLNPTTAGSISIWTYITGDGTPDGSNLVSLVSNVNASGTLGWSLDYRTTDNKIDFYLANNGSTGNEDFSTATVSRNQWHNIIVTYDGTNKKIYIDGRLDATTARTANGNNTSNGWTFAQRTTSAARILNGQLDDVRIYNYALTPVQIKQVYNYGAAVRFAPLTGTP